MSQSRNNFGKFFIYFLVLVILSFLFWYLFSWIKKYRLANIPIYSDNASLVFESKQSLIKKITELQSTLDSNTAKLSLVSSLENENKNLKSELGRSFHSNSILARVIVPPERSIYGTLVLDVGSVGGVSVGQSVYAFESVSIGSISEVSDNSSKVLLYSSPGVETVGTVTGSNVAVTLIGRGSAEYEVRMPRDIPFELGGVISSQSLEVYTLATIQKIITDPRDPFQRLLAKAPINLQTLKWVIVK